jgi:hypothetical protein
MIATVAIATTSNDTRAPRRRLRATIAMAWVVGVLQGCSGADTVAPVAATPVTKPEPAATVAPRITRVTADTISNGSLLVVEGEALPTTSGAISATVGATALTVRGASPTRIEFEVPTGAFPCAATGSQLLRVVAGPATHAQPLVVRTATQLALTPGASASLLSADATTCVELDPTGRADARYVLAVVNTSTESARTTSYDLKGWGAGALANVASAAFAPNLLAPLLQAPIAQSTLAQSPLAPLQLSQFKQLQQFQDPSLNLHEAASARPAWSARNASTRPALKAAWSTGDLVTVNAILSSCNAGRPVQARVVYAGTRAVVLEDVTAPRAGTMDAQYRQLGAEFDRTQYPLLQQQVGNPLAMDDVMNGDGRVTMLFTRFVNDSVPGTAAYVSACNFYPRATFAASNEDELFYGRVASTWETPDEWRRAMRSTVVHESKHLASFAERLARRANFEEPWLEESTARIAEELYARSFAGGGRWKGNTGYAATVQCELQQCDDRPLMMWKHFSALHGYLRAADSLTPLGATTSSDYSYYASGWSLVRWTVDQYATDEATWLKSLVRGDAAPGLAGLAQLTGRRSDELLADWALANAVDDLPGFTPVRPELSMPSWNAADMWGGLAATFPGVFSASPVKANGMGFGAFMLTQQSLRAFSSSYVVLEGQQSGAQLLQLNDATRTLRLAIVRVR